MKWMLGRGCSGRWCEGQGKIVCPWSAGPSVSVREPPRAYCGLPKPCSLTHGIHAIKGGSPLKKPKQEVQVETKICLVVICRVLLQCSKYCIPPLKFTTSFMSPYAVIKIVGPTHPSNIENIFRPRSIRCLVSVSPIVLCVVIVFSVEEKRLRVDYYYYCCWLWWCDPWVVVQSGRVSSQEPCLWLVTSMSQRSLHRRVSG